MNGFYKVLLCIGVAAISIPAFAQITVNSALDQPAANPATSALTAGGAVTIRSAIQYANLHPGTTINFSAALNGTPITLTIAGANENACSTGDLDILAAVTITGNGPTNTIIQAGTNNTNGIDKVFSVNPLFNAAFATNISGITIRYGRNTSSFSGDGFGGGLDWEASGTGTITINNCVITDNICLDGDGGGLTFTNGTAGGSGTATVTNTIISNNRAERAAPTSGIGGGVFIGTKTTVSFTNCTISGNTVEGTAPDGHGAGVFIFGPEGPGGQSSFTNCIFSNNMCGGDGAGISSTQPLTITGCTFTGNQAGRFGGGLWINHGSFTTTITKSTFTNNTASDKGGGIYHGSAPIANQLNVSYCRFFGNTAGTHSGIGVDAGITVAENNWWGCNGGPGAAGCNTAGVSGAGSIDFTPWLLLKHTPAMTSLCPGQSTTLTASFLENSAGAGIAAGNLSALVGVPIAFNNVQPAGSTLSSVQTTIQANGQATATFNAGPTAGPGGANAVVDNASVAAAVTVTAPAGNATFAYAKSGYCRAGTDPTPTIYGTPGGTFSAPAQVSIHPSTGAIDVSASTAGGPYTITYMTPGPCSVSATFSLSIVNCSPGVTLTDALVIDNGSAGKAEPADRIQLTATISNGQAADYEGVQLTLTNDSRVTLVPGSFKSTPVAVNDAYTATMNMPLNIAAGSGLLQNDFDDDLPGLDVTAFANTSAQGGTVTVNANGGFTYTPPTGFTGDDSFTYTVTDSDNQTDSATVRIRVQ